MARSRLLCRDLDLSAGAFVCPRPFAICVLAMLCNFYDLGVVLCCCCWLGLSLVLLPMHRILASDTLPREERGERKTTKMERANWSGGTPATDSFSFRTGCHVFPGDALLSIEVVKRACIQRRSTSASWEANHILQNR
jgi:hypothetical protein